MVEETLATGRRKTAVASIRLRSGSGAVDINGRKLEEYFPLEIQRKTVLAPFEKTGGHAHYDMIIRVRGGGIEALDFCWASVIFTSPGCELASRALDSSADPRLYEKETEEDLILDFLSILKRLYRARFDALSAGERVLPV